MQASVFRPTAQRQAFALTLAILVGFLGIAVFSSLHKHQGAKNRCSLNGYDQLMMGEAEAAAMAVPIAPLDFTEHGRGYQVHAAEAARSILLRGPPSTLHSGV